MGNSITDNIRTGTIGELLVQLRLLQFGVQAAAPIKDSGNDLIAVRGEEFRSIQVKTCTKSAFPKRLKLPKHYHIIALVQLRGTESELLLDQSPVYLVSRAAYEAEGSVPADLEPYNASQHLVDQLFPVGGAV